MPTIIDSLFLELGIDTSKFSADQQKAIAKIQQFESQAKRSSGKAAASVKTVGDAFRDLTKESRIGASAERLDVLANKFKGLGQSMQVAGGAGTPFGAVAQGLGMMLSPLALGAAAIGFVGKEMWDLNSKMTAFNATVYRNAQLSGMSARNMLAWGEEAKKVGANPLEVTGGISSLQTAIQGMGIGAADATPQLIALSRLGVGFNFKSGANIEQLAAEVHKRAAASGFQNLGALRALTSPVLNDAMFNMFTDKEFDPNKVQEQIKAMEGVKAGRTLQESLKSQSVLGDLGIQKDVLAETAYGDEQGLLQAIVTILTSLLGVVNRIANFLHVPEVKNAAKAAVNAVAGAVGLPSPFAGPVRAPGSLPNSTVGRAALAMEDLIASGQPATVSAGIVGNLWQESRLDPLARNAQGMAGIGQWDKARQAAFKRQFGYQMASTGPGAPSREQQFADQLNFLMLEMRTSESKTARALAAAGGNLAKGTMDFFRLYERAGDNSFGKRLSYAEQALSLIGPLSGMVNAATSVASAVQHTVTSETKIGDIHVHTPSTDPEAHAAAVRKGISSQPLVDPVAQGVVSLATRGMVA